MPSNLKIAQIGDQSVFIKAAVSGVVREGVIAAALTSLMILIFLGSWRSTLIIATSIPLSVLGSIATLSALGETLNIMTLGGLALAVGILVDDATVTIENINYHLEQGKEVETAILDGAAQIVTPAFVSLLCICIVFVPMFFLPGVARFLFVPMAEAVMSAMICSFILSRTLGADHGELPAAGARAAYRHAWARWPAAAVAQSAGSDAADLRARLRAFSARLSRPPDAGACAGVVAFVTCFFALVIGSFALTPYLGRDFFPTVDAGRSSCTRGCASAPASKRPQRNLPRSRRRSARSFRRQELATLVDNVGCADQAAST